MLSILPADMVLVASAARLLRTYPLLLGAYALQLDDLCVLPKRLDTLPRDQVLQRL